LIANLGEVRQRIEGKKVGLNNIYIRESEREGVGGGRGRTDISVTSDSEGFETSTKALLKASLVPVRSLVSGIRYDLARGRATDAVLKTPLIPTTIHTDTDGVEQIRYRITHPLTAPRNEVS
jgi:hypothetical protein